MENPLQPPSTAGMRTVLLAALIDGDLGLAYDLSTGLLEDGVSVRASRHRRDRARADRGGAPLGRRRPDDRGRARRDCRDREPRRAAHRNPRAARRSDRGDLLPGERHALAAGSGGRGDARPSGLPGDVPRRVAARRRPQRVPGASASDGAGPQRVDGFRSLPRDPIRRRRARRRNPGDRRWSGARTPGRAGAPARCGRGLGRPARRCRAPRPLDGVASRGARVRRQRASRVRATSSTLRPGSSRPRCSG